MVLSDQNGCLRKVTMNLPRLAPIWLLVCISQPIPANAQTPNALSELIFRGVPAALGEMEYHRARAKEHEGDVVVTCYINDGVTELPCPRTRFILQPRDGRYQKIVETQVDGSITITLPDDRSYVIKPHSPTQAFVDGPEAVIKKRDRILLKFRIQSQKSNRGL